MRRSASFRFSSTCPTTGRRIVFGPLQVAAQGFGFDLEIEHDRNTIWAVLCDGFANSLGDQFAGSQIFVGIFAD